jgi:hypothetical protein
MYFSFCHPGKLQGLLQGLISVSVTKWLERAVMTLM